MDLADAITNIQNEQYDFMEKYLIKPKDINEHNLFINFCKEKGITLMSGKSPSTVPFKEKEYERYSFVFIHNKNGIHLTYDYLKSPYEKRKDVSVESFLNIYEEQGISE